MWLYPGKSASWHFLTVPKKESEEIKKTYGARAKGWGSLPVEVHIGKLVWTTSIFPDKRSGTYLLPLKAKIRGEAGIFEGDRVTCTIIVVV